MDGLMHITKFEQVINEFVDTVDKVDTVILCFHLFIVILLALAGIVLSLCGISAAIR